MPRLTTELTLAPESPIDLHMHTTYSDGRWSAEELIAYLVAEGFVMVAVTDHDRVDTVAGIQELAAKKQLAVLAGVEMSTRWRGQMGHLLCYGFDPEQNQLLPLTQKIVRLQLENTQEVHAELRRQGYTFPRQEELLAKNDGQVRLPADNIALLVEHKHAAHRQEALQLLEKAGYRSIHADMGEAVEAAHQSGAVCLIAHPGRRERGFTFYDPALLDQLRTEVPIDGIEIYHPYHTQEIIETYLAYVDKHNLLLSTGSDAHGVPARMPKKHRAELSRRLLERLEIPIS